MRVSPAAFRLSHRCCNADTGRGDSVTQSRRVRSTGTASDKPSTRKTDASAVDIAAILPVPVPTIHQVGRRGHLGGYCETAIKETRWHIGSVLKQTVTNAA